MSKFNRIEIIAKEIEEKTAVLNNPSTDFNTRKELRYDIKFLWEQIQKITSESIAEIEQEINLIH